MRNVSFVVLVGLFLVAIAAVSLHYYLRARRSAQTSWGDLLKRLTWIDRNSIATIALDVIEESGEPRHRGDGFALDPASIWTLLGGLEGLETLERNCQVLIDLAAYLQTWYPEALVVAEQLRLNAREIEWHVGRLRGAAQTGNLMESFAAYAQRAVVTYYLMTQHLLELYSHAGFPKLAELQQAL